MAPRSRSDTLRLLGAGGLVAVLLAGVMLAAGAPRDGFDRSDAGFLGRAVLVLAAVLAVAAALVIASSHVPWRSPYFWLQLAIAAALASFFAFQGGAGSLRKRPRPLPPRRRPPPKGLPPPGSRGAAISLGLKIVVIIAIAAACWHAYRWWRDPETQHSPDAPKISLSALDEAIEAALIDLHSGGDHRRAVIAAYAAAEAALAAHGARRSPSESPIEYLDRVVRVLGAKGAAVDRLTALYEQARFSEHTIDAGMRDQAIAAFAGLRSELQDVT